MMWFRYVHFIKLAFPAIGVWYLFEDFCLSSTLKNFILLLFARSPFSSIFFVILFFLIFFFCSEFNSYLQFLFLSRALVPVLEFVGSVLWRLFLPNVCRFLLYAHLGF